MNGYTLTIAAMALMALGVAQGQAQNYDLKNTESLENPIGFSVLEMESPIAADERMRNREAQTLVPVPVEDVVLIEPAAGEVAPVIIKTKKVVGNTDTGVTPQEMKKALDEME